MAPIPNSVAVSSGESGVPEDREALGPVEHEKLEKLGNFLKIYNLVTCQLDFEALEDHGSRIVPANAFRRFDGDYGEVLLHPGAAIAGGRGLDGIGPRKR
ncbi:hypothetical protein [Arthrobacter sp. JUb115]|uniref:hypothetical protein n=1 Tax=Arthrobacter sp. JUb115 TaxID=2485108 RepID=UPI000CFAE6EC|nr:hypothetical protein [Arthrobacter sp. JUb115]PQZ88306.1 hypothetical protein CQ016_06060 [Arthrobacter sp. MYb222]